MRRILLGDCIERLRELDSDTFDCILTDPPYGLTFLNRDWDRGVPGIPYWAETLRVSKPGGHALIFGGTRTYHRLACAVEDAGWVIRDCLMWLYGCLSEDTEILTESGWRGIGRDILAERIVCFDPDTGGFHLDRPRRYFEYENQHTAYRIHSDHTDQIVSRNHRCVVKRGGKYVFQRAETLEQEVDIPVLESLRGLSGGLSSTHEGTSDQKQDVFAGVSATDDTRSENRSKAPCRSAQGADGGVCCVREGDMATGLPFETYRTSDLQPSVQRSASGGRLEESRPQRQVCVDGRVRSETSGKDGRGIKPVIEGWKSESPQAEAPVRSVSEGLSFNGAVRRVGCRTPPCNDAVLETTFDAQGSGSPYQQGYFRQSHRESGVISEQRGSPAVRVTKATVTEISYHGRVWCVSVPSGAFVARRKGKIFITGNSGFPGSHDISKAIDKKLGAEREIVRIPAKAVRNPKIIQGGHGIKGGDRPYLREAAIKGYHETVGNDAITPEAQRFNGYGTSLKSAYEPIILAMKPTDGTYADNALRHGLAGLNIEASRIPAELNLHKDTEPRPAPSGRWPANVVLSHSPLCTEDGCVELCPVRMLDDQSGQSGGAKPRDVMSDTTHAALAKFGYSQKRRQFNLGDKGGASRFFYCAKASPSERGASNRHPTVKPLRLICYLLKLLLPPGGGIVLDPFFGSGTTGVAAILEGCGFVGIEKEREYFLTAKKRILQAAKGSIS